MLVLIQLLRLSLRCRGSPDLARGFLLHPVNKDEKRANGQDSSNNPNQCYVIHCSFLSLVRLSFPNYFLIYCTMWVNALATVMTAGPTVTTPIAGKIKKTSGGTSLI